MGSTTPPTVLLEEAQRVADGLVARGRRCQLRTGRARRRRTLPERITALVVTMRGYSGSGIAGPSAIAFIPPW
jgi:hypothetical protein